MSKQPVRFFIACITFSSLFFSSGSISKLHGNPCRTPGTYDSFVLALSWTPGFCRTHALKKECEEIKNNNTPVLDYAKHSFTLHGLWPQKSSCGQNYGFCSGHFSEKKGFCSLPPIGLDNDVFSALDTVMPSAYAGTCLQRHEWYKHGTCVSPKDPDGYFIKAIRLTRMVNDSAFVKKFIVQHIGKNVAKNDVQNAFDLSFGKNSYRRMALYCQGNNLTEIRINLPKNIGKYGNNIKTLIPKAQPVSSSEGSCGVSLNILAVHKNNELQGN